jgi:hypothetical protein
VIAVLVMVPFMVLVVVAITVMDHHDFMMTTDISVVLVIAVAVSDVNRYAAFFREHYRPIRRSRSSKCGTTHKQDCGSC